MSTYTVTTGNDVTQYTVSTGARGPKGDAGASTASDVSFSPTGNIAATNVQAALAELDSEKAAASSLGTAAAANLLDEDDMASNSDTAVPSQKSVKAYVDANSVTAANVAAVLPAAIAEDQSATQAAIGIYDPTMINPGVITSWVAAGDSITSDDIPTATYDEPTWTWLADSIIGESFGRINDVSTSNLAFAAGGHSTANFLATQLPKITALNPKPSHCFLQYGTNDISGAGQVPVLSYLKNYQTAVDGLRAAGIEPIIMSIPQATPYSSDIAISDAGRESMVATWNDALWDFCLENNIHFLDNRPIIENQNIPGAGYRGLFNEGDLYGLHPTGHWHWQVGYNVARCLKRYGTGADEYTYTTINPQPNFETNTPTITNGKNITTSGSLKTRNDGKGGNLFEVIVENNGTKVVGSSTDYITLTPATGMRLSDFDVQIFEQNNYYGVGGTVGTPTTVPAIAVETIKGTNRKLIIVKPARPSTTFTSTVQQVADAINNDPVASALCSAAITGTASNPFPSSSVDLSTMPLCSYLSYHTGTNTAAEIAVDAGDQIRGIVEVWCPKGSALPSARLYARAVDGSGYAVVSNLNPTSRLGPIPAPTQKMVIATPWVTASTKHYRTQILVYFGGSEGTYLFGRAAVQTRTP